MDGKTTKITLAAQKATELGMIVITSAGNSGHTPWKYITAPADAPGVISVGATLKSPFAHAAYSSIGPEYNEFVKPNIACYSNKGTSYAAPAIAGLVACMKQLFPKASPKDMMDALAYAGHLYPYPNNYIGYGVPDPQRMMDYLNNKSITEAINNKKQARTKTKISTVKDLQQAVVVFHKTDETIVVKQLIIKKDKQAISLYKRLFKKEPNVEYTIVKNKDGKFKFILNKPENVQYTTVVIDGEVQEIEWK